MIKMLQFFLLLISGIGFTAEIVDTTDKSTAVAVTVQDSAGESILNDWQFFPGDAIRITVTPDTGFPNGVYPVDGEGYVDLPMIGPLQVTSMGKADFEEKVKKAYIPLLRYSSVQVRRVISISFQGGFHRPGVYWMPPGATLWYALSIPGGTVREDGLKRIKWERDGKKMEQKVTELLKMPKTISELGFKSGDVIRVLNRPKKTGWEVFRQDIVPLISLGLSSAVTAITLYEWSDERK